MKIVTEMPGPTDGTQWYRGAGPLGALSQANTDIRVEYKNIIDWGTLKAANILFLLRPSTTRQLSYIQLAKELGVKVWIDYDDYLLDIPKDNPSHGYFNNSEIKKNIELCLNSADVVTVSTPHLNDLFSKLTKTKMVTIPNAIDDNLLKHRPKLTPNKTIVMWRGTSTHQRDLMEYADQIVSVAQHDEKIKFSFVGYNPWFIVDRIPRQALHFPPVDLFQFNQALCALRPKITIVPLHDSDFNRSKSNIAALEGSMAGSVILAPNWDEWKIPGVVNYDDKASFTSHLEELIEEPDLSVSAKHTWDHIFEHICLSRVNSKRLDLILELR